MKRTVLIAALASCVPPQSRGTHVAEWISDTSSFGATPAARVRPISDRYAAVAVLAYVIADLPDRIDAP